MLSLFDIWKEAEAQGSQLPAQLYFASLWLAKFTTINSVHSMTMMKDLPAQVGNFATNGQSQAITANDKATGDREKDRDPSCSSPLNRDENRVPKVRYLSHSSRSNLTTPSQ